MQKNCSKYQNTQGIHRDSQLLCSLAMKKSATIITFSMKWQALVVKRSLKVVPYRLELGPGIQYVARN